MHRTDQAMLPSAFLYVPADRPELVWKAAAASPALILDLEDSVALDHKVDARANVTSYLDTEETSCETWVRVSRDFLVSDVEAISRGRKPAGVMVAKADLASLKRCADALPGVPLIALIETASTLVDLRELARVETLVTFAVGEVDLLADLRISNTSAMASVIDTLRLEIVRAAAATGLHPPVGPTSLEVRNTSSLGETTAHLRDLGFRSRTAIHPSQCPPIIEAFTPTPDEVAGARIILDSLAHAGGGAAVGGDGRFIDAAVVRHSEEIMSRAAGMQAGSK